MSVSKNNLDQAIAAAREALAEYWNQANDSSGLGSATEDILAALDAARGQAVAWVDADTLAEVEPQYALRTSLYGSNTSGDRIPLYAAPPAALAVSAGYVPVSALIEAREEVESWAAYATPYFQDKHDLAEVLAKIDGQIAAAKGDKP